MKSDSTKSVAVFLPILILAFLFTGPASAEIYRWVDENGVTHFSDRKPTGKDSGKEQVVNPSGSGTLSVIEGGSAVTVPPSRTGEKPAGEETREINRNASVIIYTTDTWPYSRQALEFLRRNGIRYTNYNIRHDTAAKERMLKINSKGSVPTALINGRKIVGFSEESYRKMLSTGYWTRFGIRP
jgi:glutaredoxin